MISFDIGNLQVNFERRPGMPRWYFERYCEGKRNEYETVIIGLPGVHVEASLKRASGGLGVGVK